MRRARQDRWSRLVPCGLPRACCGRNKLTVQLVPPQTFAILELPEPVASKLVAIRRRVPGWIPDPPNPHLTIVGSNGVGCFAPDQRLATLRRKIARIAADFAPIRVQLGKVDRFPNSDVFAFRLREDVALHQLHQRIVNCGLAFQPVSWPFAPHVTISQRSSISDEQAAGLYTLCVADIFMLDAISIYNETVSARGERSFQLLSRIGLGQAPAQRPTKGHG